MNTNISIDTRLNQEEMNFLWDIISEKNKENWNYSLVGNISKSELIVDKDNWFFKSVLKKLTERMFYRNWDNYSRYHIEVEEPLPEFEMSRFWVNYQKQHEFNPPHNHSGLYSFVIFMKIPTHWEEQHALSFSANSGSPKASDFEFIVGEESGWIKTMNIPLSPEDEGRILFFPAWLNHQVFPFYGTEEKRITISGNIDFSPEKVGEGEQIRIENTKKGIEEEIRREEKQMIFYEEQLKFLRKQLKKVED